VEMNEKAVKKIIAREGLILLGLFLLGVIYQIVWVAIHLLPTCYPTIYFNYLTEMRDSGFAFLFWAYLPFIIIRFIIWATRTLREK